MVKTKNALFSGDARGSVGAFTASRNRSGQTFKQKVAGKFCHSPKQQQNRATMQMLTKLFQDLPKTSIDAWNAFAQSNPEPDVWGINNNLTGMNWFIRLNQRRLPMGLSAILTPPISGRSSYTPTMRLENVENVGAVFTFSPPPALEQFIFVSWSRPLPRSKMFLDRNMRIQKIIDSSDISPLTLLPPDTGEVQRQFTAFAMDEFGRVTPTLRLESTEGAPIPPPEPVIVQSNGYAMLDQANPTFNNSNTLEAQVRRISATQIRESILRFDTSNLPSAGTVSSATLTIDTNNFGGNTPVVVHQVLVNNITSEATWIKRTSSENWSVAGGAFGVDWGNTVLDSKTLIPNTANQTLDVTSAVQNWIDGQPENGIIIIPNTSVNTLVGIISNFSENPEQRPFIDVQF